ncbi:MAG TPA: CsgG/HfaB family protein [Deltaproteobacteria bacterium]|nr:CsgG/HfaB family protein [Deltaproteobacteria bacterium]HOM30149.1 CsgG/HfaB family protein [Deltaproteobacteria bacterium]HPP80363.1 CsgG/HfaB family protein [Deltaproteobacteria bacterium]
MFATRRILPAAILVALLAPSLHAGQVVMTDDERSWARDALRQEASAQARPGKNTVAVLAFRSRSQGPDITPLQKGFAYLLQTDLSRIEGITVVERLKIQALLEELDLGASGLVEEGTAPRVGRLLGARFLVGGELAASSGQDLKVRSDVLQVPDQSTLGSPSAEGMLEQVFDIEKKILFEVVSLLKVKLSARERQELSRAPTQNYRAFVLFCKGIDAADRGNLAAARNYFDRALALDPAFTPARNAVEELTTRGLSPKKPGSSALIEAQAEQNSSTLSITRTTATIREFRPSATGQIRVTW